MPRNSRHANETACANQMRKIARGTATLVGVIFGVLSALFASGGGHGPICEAVLAGSPLTVFAPDYMLVPGSILFWGCLGFFWHRVVICRYLVAVHLSFAVAAFAFVPDYRDWARLLDAPSEYKYETIGLFTSHVLIWLVAVARREKQLENAGPQNPP